MQAGIGGQVLGGFPVGARLACGPAHEPGYGGSVGALQAQQVVERAATGPAFHMMVVVAPQFDGSEKRLHAAGAVAVDGFEGQRLLVVGQQGPVVV